MAFHNPLSGLKRWQLITVIGGASGIAGYMVYRHHKTTGSWNPWSSTTSAAGASGATSTAINPITGLSYSDDNATDPITGQPYLSEAQQYGTVAAAEAAVTAYGQSTATGSGIPVNPASPAPSGSINTPVGTDVYTSNAAWSQAATAGLVSVGYDGPTVAAAIGDYLTQTPLTPAQIAIVNTAIAEYGAPPIGSLQVIPQPASGPGQGIPVTAPTISGGKVLSASTTSITYQFNQNGATKVVYNLVGAGLPSAGKSSTAAVSTTQVQANFTGLQKGHSYTLYITPYNSSGTGGAQGHIDGATTQF